MLRERLLIILFGLSTNRIEADPELLFNATSQIKYNAKRMKKLEKDYAAMKTKEQEEMVELRVSYF